VAEYVENEYIKVGKERAGLSVKREGVGEYELVN
jgi:hypothetical protein